MVTFAWFAVIEHQAFIMAFWLAKVAKDFSNDFAKRKPSRTLLRTKKSSHPSVIAYSVENAT
jgi:hypothetical protein